MKKLLQQGREKIFGLKELDRDQLLYHVFPRMLLEIMRKYFRMEVEGVEHLPQKGRGLIIPNHSGYSGFDAFLLNHEIYQNIKRAPKVLAHQFWFLSQATSIPAERLGFVEATSQNGLKYLKKDELVVLFPEGEYGNFKPTTKAYRLQEFKRGFVRMALETQSPIIPTLVIGAEETHINLRRLRLSKFLYGKVLPLPFNIIPLPAKWKIKFFPPIELPYAPEAANDKDLVHEIADDIREKMQSALTKEIRNRKGLFL